MKTLRLLLALTILGALAVSPASAQFVGGGGGGGGGGGVITDIQDGAGDSTMNAGLNAMNMVCVSGCGGSGGTSQADDAAFVVGVNDVNPTGYMFDDVSPDSVNEGDAGIPRMSANRVPYSILRDASGQERGANVNASNALLVVQTGELPAGTQNIGDVDVASIVPGTGATNLGKAEDAAHSSADVGIAALCVRHDTATTGLGADGDYANCGISAAGRIYVDALISDGSGALNVIIDSGTVTTVSAVTEISNALPAGDNNIGNVDIVTMPNVTIGTFPDNEPINVAQMNGVAVTMGNGASGTGVQRVTLASDSTGNIATIGTSITPGTAAANLGKAIGNAAGATDTGVAPLAVRDDALSTLSDAEGDYVPLRVDSTGALHVTGGGGGTQYQIGSVASATASGNVLLVIRDDALTTLADADGDLVGLRVDSIGSLHVTIDSIAASAASATVTEDGSIPADATAVTEVAAVLYCDDGTNPVHCGYTTAGGLKVNVAADIPGTGATNLGKAVDSASGATDTGVAVLAIRDDSLSALTPAEGDYVHLRVSSTGALHVTGGGGGTQYNIGDVAPATATGTATLAIRDDTLSTLADAEGDFVGLRVNSQGALHVTGGGGGTEYVVNAAAPTDPTGATFTMERDDALSTLTEIEGDWTNPRATAEGALWTQDFNSDAMLSALNTVAGAVSGTEMQVDVLTLPNVTIGTFPDNEPFNLAQIAGTTTATGNGTVSAGVQRVAIASDNTAFTVNIGTFPDNEPINIAQMNGVAVTMGNGVSGTGVQRVTLASDSTGQVAVASIAAGDNNIGNVDVVTLPSVTIGTFPDNEPFNLAQVAGGTAISGGITGSVAIGGNVAHDSADSTSNPVKIGGKAVAHGTNPTAVTAADRTDWYFNRHGIPFTIGGHPNAITVSAQIQDADGAQTNAAIVTVGAGAKVVVTRLTASCDNATTNGTNIKVGFGTATLPASAHTGVAGILHEFDNVPPGGGFTIGDGSGILGVGADNEDLRITTEDPAGGNCTVSATYFTIES